ncbi:MAG TPA: hypothetical protein VG325_06485 [Solirubrobacteraceae bacterium]|nr:hypothetical protein [Solirubrobacteraceae bacterium]
MAILEEEGTALAAERLMPLHLAETLMPLHLDHTRESWAGRIPADELELTGDA